MANYEFSDGLLLLNCARCDTESSHDLSAVEMPFLEEFGEYQNLAIPCPHCGELWFLNMGLPEFEEDEDEDLLAEFAPPEELENRRAIRDVMWAVRADLKLLDRAAEIAKKIDGLLPEVPELPGILGGVQKTKKGTK